MTPKKNFAPAARTPLKAKNFFQTKTTRCLLWFYFFLRGSCSIHSIRFREVTDYFSPRNLWWEICAVRIVWCGFLCLPIFWSSMADGPDGLPFKKECRILSENLFFENFFPDMPKAFPPQGSCQMIAGPTQCGRSSAKSRGRKKYVPPFFVKKACFPPQPCPNSSVKALMYVRMYAVPLGGLWRCFFLALNYRPYFGKPIFLINQFFGTVN